MKNGGDIRKRSRYSFEEITRKNQHANKNSIYACQEKHHGYTPEPLPLPESNSTQTVHQAFLTSASQEQTKQTCPPIK